MQGSRQARQGHPRSRPHWYGYTTQKDVKGRRNRMLILRRLPWWRDPGPRRVHGRHHPLHHPQRQGPRYGYITSTQAHGASQELTPFYSPRGRHPLPPRVRARGQETEISGSKCVESFEMRSRKRAEGGSVGLAWTSDTVFSLRMTLQPAACSTRRYGRSAASG